MEYLPNLKLLENANIEVYANQKYPESFINRLKVNFIKKEKHILDFFEISTFRKVRINLFDSKESYINFSSQFSKISPYSLGNCFGGMINYVCISKELEDFYRAGFLIASVAHELVHLIYHEKVSKFHCIWLEEGLAQYLSGQKSFLEADNQKYLKWLEKEIFSKEIPPIDFLKHHGGKYGQFCDCDTNKYNGYDISYALVRFIIESYNHSDIINIIKNKEMIQEIEKNIIEKFKKENESHT